MKTTDEHHNFYLKTDVLLLADAFEKLICVCSEHYWLDPFHHFNSPGLIWGTLLKKSGVELELISDTDMYFFVEKGIRGDICYSALKDKAKLVINTWNRIIMVSEANISRILMQIIFYGWTMNQYRPYCGFRWLKQKWIDGFDVISISENILHGYILAADLEYPDELHGLHNDFPLVPTKVEIVCSMLPRSCNDIAN